jgi:hypothetical protein
MTAYCGLNCNECPTYQATQANDIAKREKVASDWSKFFGVELTAEDINCDGCKSKSEVMFMHCKNCNIKSCCQSKEIDTCADCNDYPCETLNGFFTMMPVAKENLETIRKNR